MARPVRIHIPGALYLLQIRVRPDQPLFSSEEERALFLASVGEAAEAYGVTIYAYALLEFSALLFARAGELPLSRFIHRCQAGYFNRLKALDFRALPRIRDRHRAILVEDGPLFVDVMRRVHLAPIIGGHWSNESEGRRIGEILKSRWTSLPMYSGQQDPPAWFNTHEAIRRLSHLQPGRPQEAPFWYIMQGAKQLHRDRDILDDVRAMSLLGSDEFVKQHYGRARGRTGENSQRPAAGNRPADERARFRSLVQLIAKHYKAKPADLTRARSRHPGRKVLVELALRHLIGDGGVKELGKRLGVSGSALAHLRKQVHRTMQRDAGFAETLAEIETQFLAREASPR